MRRRMRRRMLDTYTETKTIGLEVLILRLMIPSQKYGVHCGRVHRALTYVLGQKKG